MFRAQEQLLANEETIDAEHSERERGDYDGRANIAKATVSSNSTHSLENDGRISSQIPIMESIVRQVNKASFFGLISLDEDSDLSELSNALSEPDTNSSEPAVLRYERIKLGLSEKSSASEMNLEEASQAHPERIEPAQIPETVDKIPERPEDLSGILTPQGNQKRKRERERSIWRRRQPQIRQTDAPHNLQAADANFEEPEDLDMDDASDSDAASEWSEYFPLRQQKRKHAQAQKQSSRRRKQPLIRRKDVVHTLKAADANSVRPKDLDMDDAPDSDTSGTTDTSSGRPEYLDVEGASNADASKIHILQLMQKHNESSQTSNVLRTTNAKQSDADETVAASRGKGKKKHVWTSQAAKLVGKLFAKERWRVPNRVDLVHVPCTYPGLESYPWNVVYKKAYNTRGLLQPAKEQAKRWTTKEVKILRDFVAGGQYASGDHRYDHTPCTVVGVESLSWHRVIVKADNLKLAPIKKQQERWNASHLSALHKLFTEDHRGILKGLTGAVSCNALTPD